MSPGKSSSPVLVFLVSSPSCSSSPLSSVDNTNSAKQDVVRNSVIFHAGIWGDQFLEYDEKVNVAMERQSIKELKEQVRKELTVGAGNEAMQDIKLIELIDAVQHLGIGYHFEEEIEETLQHIFVTCGDKYIFKNHRDEKGNFQKSLCDDPRGMLALYEAAHMRVEGEEVLDKALEFTKIHLGIISKDPSCDSSLRTEIEQALKQPLRRKLPRLEAVRYIPIYQQKASHNEVLLKLAKLDFNVLQEMHKEELSHICKLIEGYFWILGIYFEPQHSHTRKFLMKTCMWLIVLDDTFDNYGTYEELRDVHTSCRKGYTPTLEEYMSNSLVTCGYALMTTRSYVARDDDIVTEDAFKWVATHPPLVKATCKILRLMDDIATYKEQERGHIASSIECYRKETGASEEEACAFFSKHIEDAWKVINRESLRPTDVPFPLLIPAINLASVSDTLYKDNDGYNHADKEVVSYIKWLFVHPMIV
ncbi:(E)-beta-farnesene synthase-like protein [Tanacetum coccineum]